MLNDADIEQAEADAAGNHAAALRRRGICTHSATGRGSAPDAIACSDCGEEFPSWDDYIAARHEVLNG